MINSKKSQAQFIYNDYNINLLMHLEAELKNCSEFYFSVAFITQSGLIVLKNTLIELAKKNIKGYILTTDYLGFTQPKALEELLSFDNLQVRVYTKENFHVKGYIFKHKKSQQGSYSLIIGSSNLTQNALKVNKEWNLKVQDEVAVENALQEFQKMWQASEVLTKDWIVNYAKIYREIRKSSLNGLLLVPSKEFLPNKMQQQALASLERLQKNNKDKALLISATGTGKTYLSAFAVKRAKPKRLLFLAHREQILKQAIKTFKKVMPNINAGLLTANDKSSADYLFATISMMSKDDVYTKFAKMHFDYIIIDETHRAGAFSYQKILNYFKPQFLLGMTATPERTDGFDIYKVFDYNIAYEIRLKEAMQEDLLCPFHYFGITDISVENREISDLSTFNDLVADERVDYILEKAKVYGYSGNRVRGLIFCRKIEEAQVLSQKFNERKFATTVLCGKDNQITRQESLKRLAQKERAGGLDYIFTVDILNEGIDVPEINQLIMLRPTQSSIIFVQQLGRGLRKFKHKEYLVVLDFIGNYQNNFMIPIALSGDISYNKDDIRRYLTKGNQLIAGASTINFDEISRQRIYQAIDSAKFAETSFLKTKYMELKQKIGRIPKIADFETYGSVNILKYMDKFGTYHHFLQRYEKDYVVTLVKAQEELLLFVSQRFAKGKRAYELIVLNYLLSNLNAKFTLEDLCGNLNSITKTSIINNLTNVFTISNERAKYANCVFIKEVSPNTFSINPEFKLILQNVKFKQILSEIISFGLDRYQKYYINRYENTNFVLYQKYTYEEVCYLLNFPCKINPNAMAGYFYEKTTHTMPVFINYINPEEKRVDYTNEFLSDELITAYSKSNRKLDSTDAKHIYKAKEEGNLLYLFVRKPNNDKEAKEFYFLGEISAYKNIEPAPKYNGFKVIYKLKTPVRKDLFDYFTH